MDNKSGTPIYGDSRAALFRDGKYYDAEGREVSMEDAGKPAIPAPPPNKAQVAASAKAEAAKGVGHDTSGAGLVAQTEASGPRRVEPNSAEARRVGVAQPDGPDPKAAERARVAEAKKRDAKQARLSKLHGNQIAKMVVDAGGTPATGEGARQSNERWLLEHTAD